MKRTNVLVIGGGPAGATAARFLALHGIDAILLERDLSYTKPCGGAIPSSAFRELDIPKEVVKNEVTRIRVVSPKGEEVNINLTGGTFCITERHDFDSTLRKIAQSKGAELIEAEFVRFEKVGPQIISVARDRRTNEEFKIASDYVIASDGITFRAGAAMGMEKPNHVYTISAYVAPRDMQPDTCEFWFGADHSMLSYSWIFPAQGFSSVGTGSEDPKLLSSLLDAFVRRRYNAPLKEFGEQNFVAKMRAFRIPVWNKPMFTRKNILFAGDAAGLVMPVSYEGIYYAMKSGQLAAEAIHEGDLSLYRKRWNSKYRNRFLLMSKVRNHLLKNTSNIERWVVLHRRADVQEMAMRLWLRKESGKSSLLSYIKLFRHIFKVW